MGLTSLMERLQYRATDTCDTPSGSGEVASEPTPVLGCTPDTFDTRQFNQSRSANDSGADPAHSAVTGEISEPDAKHDESSAFATEAGYVWSAAEIVQFTQRRDLFVRSDMAETVAEKLAEGLLTRDREGDDRCLCAECWNCSPRLHCGQGKAILDVLQRCDHFNLHPELESQINDHPHE
jgi:hypothetical protein